MQEFDIYFLGETLPDTDPASVRGGVARLFKIQEDAVERLFSGRAVRVKQGVDADTASRYRAAFREVGALVKIVPGGSPTPAAAKAPQPAPAAAGSGARANTSAEPGLAEPGAILDNTPPAPAAEIDTGTLEALPPNTGTLEDCSVEKPPRPIPDISHLSLVDD